MSGDNSNLSDADKVRLYLISQDNCCNGSTDLHALCKIRLKRLARLGTPAQPQESSPQPSASAPPGSGPSPGASQPPKPEQKTPISNSKPATPQPAQQRINIKPASSPQPGPSHSPAPPPPEPFEQWEENAVGHAFYVTLDVSASLLCSFHRVNVIC